MTLTQSYSKLNVINIMYRFKVTRLHRRDDFLVDASSVDTIEKMVVPLKWQRVRICGQTIYFTVHGNEKFLEE